MIRYPISLEEIKAAIDAKSPSWQKRAAVRTKLFEDLSKYTEEYRDPTGAKQSLSPFWSEVKSVYMQRQHNKCIYCETKLEGGPSGAIQWDLEHFRPKGHVRKWPSKNSPYDFATGDESPIGYYLLAYHLGNYAAACKTCNSPFKSDYFPIASARVAGRPNPADYATEQSFLVYPLGNTHDDPEDLITFIGAEAIPKYKLDNDELKWQRGRVIIDFFGLNRDGLVKDRAWWLLHAVWPTLKNANNNDTINMRNLNRIQSERAQFTSCSKCFIALFSTDYPLAASMLPEFEKIVESMEE